MSGATATIYDRDGNDREAKPDRSPRAAAERDLPRAPRRRTILTT